MKPQVKTSNGMKALQLLMMLSLSMAAAAKPELPGYWYDRDGNVVRSGSGECMHTRWWTPDKAIVGCDGVMADVDIKLIEGLGTGGTFAVQFPTAALFEFDKAVLTEEGRERIDEQREALREEFAEAYAAVIFGHADSQGPASYNMDLSQRRAEAVKAYLVEIGAAPADRLRAVGRGESEPLMSNDSEVGRAHNRRVEVVAIASKGNMAALKIPAVPVFERGSSKISEAGEALIEGSLEEARDIFHRAQYIEIVGHTDTVGDDRRDKALSLERAKRVRDELVEAGVDPNMIRVFGMGSREPIAEGHTETGRALNRRVEVLVMGRLEPEVTLSGNPPAVE